jgi:hypothetical protein
MAAIGDAFRKAFGADTAPLQTRRKPLIKLE